MELTWLTANDRIEVKKFYRQHMPYARLLQKESICILTQADSTSANDIEANSEQIIASVRIRPIGQLSILTGMLVHPDYRGQGVGHQLMDELESVISNGNTYIFALAHLEGFYAKHGFCAVTSAPNDIEQLFAKYQCSDKELVLMGISPSV